MASIVVMLARPYDPSVTATVLVPEGPDGPIPDGSHTDILNNGGLTTVYAAWAASGYTTAAADTPASTYIPARIVQPFSYNFQLFGDEDLTQPGAYSGGGAMVFADPDGDLDSWLDYAWDGRDITLYRGDSAAAFSTFTVVARLTCDGWGEVSRVRKALRIRDLGWRMATAIPIPRYTGTGGVEGGASVAGITKPFGVGFVNLVRPILIDEANQVYQYHYTGFDSTTQNPFEVYVGGVVYSTTSDYASYEALVSATLAAGAWARCKQEGLIRLGNAPPSGQEVRCGVRGNGGTRLGEVIPAFVETMARIAAPGNFVITCDSTVDGTQDIVGGIWIGPGETAPTIGDALNAMTYPTGWYWWPDLSGVIHVRALTDPAGETATVTIDGARAYSMANEMVATVPLPRAVQTLLHSRYFPPQITSSIAGSVTQESAEDLGREWRDVTTSNLTTTGVEHPSARTVVGSSAWNTGLAVGAMPPLIAARASELLRMFATQRYIVTVRVSDLDPLDPPIGEIVELQNFNRIGFGASKKFLCIGCKANLARNSLELTLWG